MGPAAPHPAAAPRPAAPAPGGPPPAGSPPPGPGPVNGISWSEAPNVPVPAYPTWSLAPLAGEIAGLPLQQAQTQAAIQQAQTQTLQQQGASDDATLTRLLPALRANPALGNSPQFLQHIKPILERRGLTMPLNPDGSVDAATLTKMIAPSPVMTSPEVDQMYNSITTKEKALGTGGYTPQLFLEDVKSARARLADSGQSTAPLDTYLNADGTQLSDSFVDNYVGQKTTEEISHLQSLGVHLTNEDAYRQAVEKEKKAEFQQTLGYKYTALSAEEKKWANQAQVAQTRIGLSQQNLDARMQSLQLAQQKFGVEQTSQNLSVYRTLLNGASKQLTASNQELLHTQSLIANIAANPSSLARPEVKQQYDALVAKALALQQSISQQAPMLEAQQAAAQQGVANIYSGITGSAASTPQPYGAAVATDKNGKQVFNNNGKYVYADGSPYVVPK
jgi:hypothetical protein